MDTVSVATRQRHNHSYVRNHNHNLNKLDSMGSPPLNDDYQGINCRAFQSGAGLLSNPSRGFPKSKSLANHCTFSPKTPLIFVKEHRKCSTRVLESNPITKPMKIEFENKGGDFRFSELWAGPDYSNSPPPCSLPMHKFSVKPKRTVSLELQGSISEVEFQPISKSAPTSPTRERIPSPYGFSVSVDAVTKTISARDLFDKADSASKTLRRILNLDTGDD